MPCCSPGSSVHGTSQARILEWVAISFSRRSSWPRDWTQVSHIVGRCFTVWATREVQTWFNALQSPSWDSQLLIKGPHSLDFALNPTNYAALLVLGQIGHEKSPLEISTSGHFPDHQTPGVSVAFPSPPYGSWMKTMTGILIDVTREHPRWC